MDSLSDFNMVTSFGDGTSFFLLISVVIPIVMKFFMSITIVFNLVWDLFNML